jgi:hypothetical protein
MAVGLKESSFRKLSPKIVRSLAAEGLAVEPAAVVSFVLEQRKVDEPPNALTEVNKAPLRRKFEFLSTLTALRHSKEGDMMPHRDLKTIHEGFSISQYRTIDSPSERKFFRDKLNSVKSSEYLDTQQQRQYGPQAQVP